MEIDSTASKALMGFVLFKRFLLFPILRSILRIFRCLGRNFFFFTTAVMCFLWQYEKTGLSEDQEAWVAYGYIQIATVLNYDVCVYHILFALFIFTGVAFAMWQLTNMTMATFKQIYRFFCNIVLADVYFYLRIRNRVCKGDYLNFPERLSYFDGLLIVVMSIITFVGLIALLYLIETTDPSTYFTIYTENIHYLAFR